MTAHPGVGRDFGSSGYAAAAALLLLVSAATGAAAPSSVRDIPDDVPGEPRNGRLDERHMTLLGIRLDRATLEDATARLGAAEVVAAGGHHGMHEVCYEAVSGKRWVVFARRREGADSRTPISNLEIHSRRPEIECAPMRGKARDIATASGLKPGMTTAELQSRLGRPTGRGQGILAFAFDRAFVERGSKWYESSGVIATVEGGRVTSLAVWTVTTS